MPAVNALTDEGSIWTPEGVPEAGSARSLSVGGQDVSTMVKQDDNNYCNVHVALFVLLGAALIVVLRKSGVHALQLEG